MPDLELKRRFGRLYKPSATEPSLVDVPRLRFLMLDGTGDIGEPPHQDAVAAIYALAYAVKFSAKKRLDVSYPVMPLEALYFDAEDRDEVTPQMRATLPLRLMIMLPDEVSAEFVDEVRARVAAKKQLERLADIRVATFSEGSAVQVMHLGPYAEQPATVERLLRFAANNELDVTGAHHEIYIGDHAKSAPEKLRTVVRYGVKRAK
jgi:hypothetical protein